MYHAETRNLLLVPLLATGEYEKRTQTTYREHRASITPYVLPASLPLGRRKEVGKLLMGLGDGQPFGSLVLGIFSYTALLRLSSVLDHVSVRLRPSWPVRRHTSARFMS